MSGATRVGVDAAGGQITGSGESSVKVNGATISVLGDGVTPHSPKDTPHMASPTIVSASSTVFAGGVAVVRAGDSASCGHSTSGSSNVNIG